MRRQRETPGLRSPAMELLEPRLLLAGDVLISEFMADNGETFTDGYGRQPDWIELQNTSTSPIDLTDWKLVDSGNEWIFPAITLPAHAYLLVCATDETGQDPAGYWHIGFKLTSDGEYLALLNDSGAVVHQYTPAFPRQLEDISYGVLYEEHGSEVLVDKGDAARYLVPTAGSFDPAWFQPTFHDGTWAAGTTGLGFGLAPSGGTVTLIDRGSVWSYLDDGSDQGAAWQAPSFDDSAWASGRAQLGYGDDDEATVVSYGPSASDKYITTYFRHTFNVTNAWSFTDLTVRVLRDDGAVMYLNGHELPRSNMPSGAIDYLTTTSNTSSETTFFEHSVDPTGMLVEGENVLAVEIHQSSRTSSDISFDLELIGDATTADLIETDLQAQMLGINPSALVRVPFTVSDESEFSELVLEMAYEDGYVAYLNGTPVAGDNAPGTLDWNSAALTDRPIEDAVRFESVDLTPYLDLLVSGDNLLAIHALNDGAADGAFLICPRLRGVVGVTLTETYFTTPTPGGQNTPGVLGMVADTSFSVDRGFFDEQFDLEVTTDTNGAEIRYTIDGTAPTATTGTAYSGPITISTTTTVRAAAFKPGYLSTNVDTQTYIFPEHVATQTRPAGYPTSWGSEPQADYDMDQSITLGATYHDRFIQGLTEIPTLSLVLPMQDIFGSGGLYSNPGSTTMEKATSAELIYPDGTQGFQVDAGLKMQGGASRSPGNAIKHSMSLRFRAMYGPGRLDFPLFEGCEVEEFNSLHLRAMYNNSWIHWDQGQRNRGELIRDQWMRDTLIDMGQADAAEGTYVHLYINGLHWGVYNVHERAEASHYAAHNGGDEDAIDALNSGAAVDGTTASWNSLQNMVANAVAGGISTGEFQQIQEKLDVVNLIDYMIVNHYGGNSDWDGHNWRAVGGGADDAPWRIYSWDAERVLEGTTVNRLGVNTSGKPSRLFHNLCNSADFLMLLADRLHKHLDNGGALSPEAAAQRWMERASELDLAVIAESARWGDDRPGGPYLRDNQWVTERNRLINSYFPVRAGNLLAQYQSANLYPDTVAPT
ncbi:MAG: lamin tail domain-containing protein, partial [Phycisphaerae bacterium]